MNLKRSILGGFAGGLLLSFTSVCLSFMQLRILLHYLPQTLVGIWIVFVNLGAYVNFMDLGLTQTFGREVSFTVGRPDLTDAERAARLASLIRSCTRVVLLIAVIVFVLGALAGWAYVKSVAPADQRSVLRLAWTVFFFSAALNLVGEGWYAGLYGMGRVFSEKMLRSSGLLLGFCLMAGAVSMGWGVRGLASAAMLQTTYTVTVARIVLRRASGYHYVQGKMDYGLLRSMAGPGLKYAATVLGGVLILQTDNLVIASVLGLRAIPDYQAIAKIVTTFMTLSMMLVVTTSPFMSQAHAQSDSGLIRRLLQQNQRVSLSVLVILGSCLACFADRVVRVWLGPGHFVGFAVVWVLLAMMLLEAHHLAMATATMATGKIVFVLPAILAGVINIVLSVVLAKHMGLVGVALGTLLAQITTNNWYVPFYVLRQFRIAFQDHLRQVVAPVLILLTTTLCIGAATRFLTQHLPDLTALLLGCMCILLGGASVVYFMVLSPADRMFIRSKLLSSKAAKAW